MQLDYTFERQLELEREAANEATDRAWQQGRLQEIISFVQDGDISIERGAQKAGMSMDAFRTAMAQAEQSLLVK